MNQTDHGPIEVHYLDGPRAGQAEVFQRSNLFTLYGTLRIKVDGRAGRYTLPLLSAADGGDAYYGFSPGNVATWTWDDEPTPSKRDSDG